MAKIYGRGDQIMKVLFNYEINACDIDVEESGTSLICPFLREWHDEDKKYSMMKFAMYDAKDEVELITKFRNDHDISGDRISGYMIGSVYGFEVDLKPDVKDRFHNQTFDAMMISEVEETETCGQYSYVVALAAGGEMGAPEFHYHNFQLIRADSKKEAKEKYDRLNKCSYYYGRVMGIVMKEIYEGDATSNYIIGPSSVRDMLVTWIKGVKSASDTKEENVLNPHLIGMRALTSFIDEAAFDPDNKKECP